MNVQSTGRCAAYCFLVTTAHITISILVHTRLIFVLQTFDRSFIGILPNFYLSLQHFYTATIVTAQKLFILDALFA